MSMRRQGIGLLRFGLVTMGILVLTSITIEATNGLAGSRTMLAVVAEWWLAPECASDTVAVRVAGETWCVDTFPAAPGPGCPYQTISSHIQTTENVATSGCEPIVTAGVSPWTFVARHHAVQLCARAGRTLLPGEIWYQAALGTPSDRACHTNNSQVRVNEESDCRSAVGAFDMVGNVWELVDNEAVDGQINDIVLPETGYVAAVSSGGWPIESTTELNEFFAGDYVWNQGMGTSAVMRGGFHRSRDDAGVYSVHAAVAPDFTGGATGFRCGYRL